MPITNLYIKCDECRWREETEAVNIPNWHRVSCPKCHEGEIVSDKDLKDFNRIQILMKWNDRILRFLNLIGVHPKTSNVKYDSATDQISDLPAKLEKIT